MDAAQFRTDFPEFADAAIYPDATVNLWLGVAQVTLSADRWGALLDLGTELFIAHHLAVGAGNTKAAAAGGIPGSAGGVVSSKSVDKVSVSYDTAAGTLEGGDFWNRTTYGIEFLRYARMMGAGGIQL
ncbi:DUF4054 domain-containing protein [Rhodanobacter glycinis]|uniref:DUF4054 domain-containing protein n=1 Tax=Rhodanobacter glycinis TaxID=582702 RepID=A0A5B9DX32_9GAMM|nr:DUF4054 domain-containing protein [Rhodanobacter glycinis]QEE24583.1 DUF4054 domain-containing protein [Rhodanobacter glycinis]